jgi:hypothetical protein
MGGGTAVPPLPPHALAAPRMLIEIECQYWQLLEICILYNSPLLCQIIAKLFIK